MMRLVITAMPIFVVGLLVAACLDQRIAAEPIGNPHMFELDSSGSFLLLEGKWHPETNRPSANVPSANSVHIECDRHAGTCREFMAKLLRSNEVPSLPHSTDALFAMIQDFRVVEWSSSNLTARASPRAADIEIRISFADRVVERTTRETSARGAEIADSSVIHQWVLR